ncbi:MULTISPECIES: tetratricopeptide repeat protein [unclassified Janthinobacterium]|uniref:tetratricopeptide repeat protein n=1 Tax=unclassified Janthinobacterium TaxID=2610881 RepID=UPI00161B1A8A|nr:MULTISPECIES: sel1 repeat family protein [unclassified Janthinobacterium]MBB5609477.1 TPR repeat protein [Janthinobacterium sp. S3T4]MBB5614676.1 TPR repeat protein [Janthinobacterium sp. S3M3]
MMAAAWLLAAALAAGDPAAQLVQAKALMRGASAQQPQARLLFTEAAGQGSGPAAYYLGLMVKNGMGGPQDQAAALRWLILAAQRQVVPAMFIVANMLFDSDAAQARYWLDAACEAEYPEALQQKSVALGEGRMGYVHNEEQAALFLKMAEHAMTHRQPEP